MGNGMNKVLPGLYVGNVRDSQDQVQLRANNITHIVAIHDTAREPTQQPIEADVCGRELEYLCLQAADSPSQNLYQFFAQSNDFIHTARINGGNVLVHCLAGASRSVTIAVAYIMTVTSLNSKEALKAVRGARDVASPNDGFQKQLVDFESRKLNEERRRLRVKYPRSQFWDDEKECRKLLSTYQARELVIQAEGQRQASICRSGPLLTPPSSPRRRRRTSSPLNSPSHTAHNRPHSSPSSPGHHAAQGRGLLTRASSSTAVYQTGGVLRTLSSSSASSSASTSRPSSAKHARHHHATTGS